ncbi:MAG TPA: peptidyl-alpha-hydroxyglycine alpha-amidating lyase family protein [Candidatus Hydrogenedentes bacterium]|nr:peptidyl-alpha-hydroxyglycine alpha-amidating lyase family protein [Candidatus Hydrogenedentota bacterium]
MNTHVRIVVLGLALVATFAAANAQEKTSPPPPVYPEVNPSPWYEVDAGWPQKPKEFRWQAMPGVAVDAEDNVWVYTRSAPEVQVYAPDGKYLFGWGESEGAHHIKIDREGNIWTVNFKHHIVQKHRRDGSLLLTLGVRDHAAEDDAHFYMPTDVAIASNGDIFVSDGYGNQRVVHLTKDGKFVKAWGSMGTEDGKFSIPHAIAIDSKDRIYVADRNNARVQVYNTNGELVDSWKHIIVPWGFWITAKDEVWVCGSSPMAWQEKDMKKYPTAPLGCPPRDQLIMRFDTAGKVQQVYSFPKGKDGEEKPGELNWVHCIALDSKGNVYLGDIQGKRVQKFLLKN